MAFGDCYVLTCLPLQLNSLQKELKDRNRDIEEMRMEEQKLQGIIESLEKFILALKTEIQERADTIQDEVRNWTID